MNTLVKVGLVGGIGFVLYEYLVGSGVLGSAAPATTTTTATPPVVTTPPVAQFTRPTEAQLIAAAGGVSSLNIYQWNFYYDKLTGRGGAFNSVTFPVDGATVVTASQYIGYLTQLGLSGTRSGLGAIIDLITGGDKIGWGVGDEDFLRNLGSGLSGIVDDANNSAAYIDEGPMIEASQVGTPTNENIDFYRAAGLA